MNLKDFYFELPENLIGQTPLLDRSSSKLMVLDKNTGNIKNETSFKQILNYIKEGDCLVLNDTKVLPARLIGEKEKTGSKIEFLLLNRKSESSWETLIKPAKKLKIGDKVIFGEGILIASLVEILENGNRIVEFEFDGIFEQVLDKLGQMPLPPYITKKLEDKDRYQTVYAKNKGSVAAPTAGLHFTNELLKQLEEKNIKIAKLTLHVGLGTFRPVKVENITEHKMHSEYFCIDEENANIINETKKNGGKIIVVGTTSCRTLETIADENGKIKASNGWTNIFIYPGYKFKIVDSLITNFHLPESSLIMLVSAFAKREYILKAYKEAIKNEYKFFSFGDAMFIR